MGRRSFEDKVSGMISAFAAVLENVEVECRNDEDCDHCHFLHCEAEVQEELAKRDKRKSDRQLKNLEPCGSCQRRICFCGDGPNV